MGAQTVLYDANAQVLTKQAKKRLSTYVRWNTNVYHNDKRAELPDIAAYAYQDVHVRSALRPACGRQLPTPLRMENCIARRAGTILGEAAYLLHVLGRTLCRNGFSCNGI